MTTRILCHLPAERVSLCPIVFAAQAIPVIDLCFSDRSRVPNGAWVRTRSKRDVPGKGPVILAGGQHRSPIRGRETWLEVTKPRKVPRGFAGIILKTTESGGWCSEKTLSEWTDKLDKLNPETTILDAALSPTDWNHYSALSFAGTVVSTQMMGFSEFGLPPNLFALLQQINGSHLLHHNQLSIAAYPLSAGLKNALNNTDWWRVCDGWLREDNPQDILAPWGSGILTAITLAQTYGTLDTFLRRYQEYAVQETESVPPQKTPSVDISENTTISSEPSKPEETDQTSNIPLEIPTVVHPRTIVTPPTHAPEPIAIVGMGCRLPKAQSISELEQLLRTGTYAIQEVPTARWNPDLFWSSDRSAEDKTYSKIGGFIENFEFNPKKFRIPPKVAQQIDLVQQLTLMSVADALEDADYTDESSVSKERVAVILGNSMGGESSDDHTVRTRLPEVLNSLETGETFSALDSETQQTLRREIEQVKAHLPTINEDTMPGELANVIAGRIANAFDFNGPNYTVDAACASSMAAIQAAVKGLRDREFDMAVTGGADRSMGVPTYVKFSKIGALSPDISAPFDTKANGFVMGEGCAILILKRLSDAQKDGDRVYATIRGVGASSDGKGKGITAPNPTGQQLALERAYQQANVDINSVEYFECHGTSTQVGDKVEATVLANALSKTDKKARLGSIKSNIGHLKSAAGAAAVLKGALSIYHQTFYPTVNVSNPRIDIPLDKIHIQTTTEKWDSNTPRRAGVSAFGFGGTNFHVVLEEQQTTTLRSQSARRLDLPSELLCISANNETTLIERLEAYKENETTLYSPGETIHVVLSSEDHQERLTQIDRLLETLRKGRSPQQLTGRGIFYTNKEQRNIQQTKAFLFTGQGSQYLNMGMELAQRFEVVQRTFEEAESIFKQEVGVSLLALIAGDSNLSTEEREAQLKDTRIAQPATLAMDIAIARLLREFGVEADMVAGHSLGEYAACVVAGIMSFTDAIQAVSARGREMASIQLEDVGKMASVAAGMDKLQPLLEQIEDYVIAANKNCPSQTVVAGSSIGVEKLIERCKDSGIRCQELPVSHAFHSNIVAPAAKPLKKFLQGLSIQSPHLPISTNVTGDWYPDSPDGIIDILSKQIASPVEWIEQINGLYKQGCRIFIECGPKRALTGLTSTTLKGREHVAIHTNHPRRGEVLSFIDCLGHLLSLGAIEGSSSETTPSARERALVKEIEDLRALLTTQQVIRSTEDSQTYNTEIVCTGASVGLPGGETVFGTDNEFRIFRGENCLSPVSAKMKNLFLMKDIVRVHKNPETGQGEFKEVSGPEECIQWAGQAQNFDFVEYGMDPKWSATLDITSKLAIVAGLEALSDAGIPLVEETQLTRSGLEKKVGWRLPKSLQADTGVIFASAFAGHTNFANHIGHDGDDGTGQFDRRFLFQVLAMGHAQFAQLIGAKGPNTHVNAACASTTQAIALAEDWIRCGRAKRVIVIGADDVTNDTMMEWIGSGFLAVGAASTESEVSNAAKPFDKSRNGMILGMGAVGLMLERKDDAVERGAPVLAELKASRISNSAFHGTRLDVEHIASEMRHLVDNLSKSTGLSVSELATETLFISHETFTPARGGSAEAEIQGLRSAFGDAAKSVLITNTKGYTGHAMGAGIEDVIAVKALQHRLAPPVPNLVEPDDSAKDLNFSTGGAFSGRFALRLAAGFGSQLALLAWERGTIDADPSKRQQWIERILEWGMEIDVEQPTPVDTEESAIPAAPDTVADSNTDVNTTTNTPSSTNQRLHNTYTLDSVALSEISQIVLRTIAHQTGYDISDLEMDYELEADLGIDTVKQAELFSELRETFDIQEDTQFDADSAPTIQSLTEWFAAHSNKNVKAKVNDQETSTQASIKEASAVEVEADAPQDASTDFIPHLFRTQWVASPILQEVPPQVKTFRLVGNTINDRHLTRALEKNGFTHAIDGKIVIERSRNVEEVFAAAKRLDAEGIKHWICLLEVITPDSHPAHIALKGGRSGLAKALAQEWPDCNSKVVWVSSKITPREVAKIVKQELYSVDSVNEIYYEQGERYALTLTKESMPTNQPGAPETMVFSGGGRGVTAEVAKGFIRAGCQRVFILGRTAPATQVLNEVEAKAEIQRDLSQTGVRVTPIMVEQRIQQLRNADTVRQNIEQMRSLGATVEFIETDIASRQAVDTAFEHILNQGVFIEAVVHGAGSEESRPLAQKDIAGFRRVYHPKVQGALNILENIPQSTFFLSMGSIAGRFGNQGQTDYAAANDAVAYICQRRNNALHVCWSAWADVGMAARGGMKQLLTQRGIDLLPVEFAVSQCVGLVGHRFLGEVIISGALSQLPIPCVQPLLSSATLTSQGLNGVASLSPKNHKWLQDHSIGDLPILPGVMGLELMMQTIATIHPKQPVEVDDVQFLRPVKFHRDMPIDLIVETRFMDNQTVACTLASVRQLAGGREQRTEHFKARFSFVKQHKHTLLSAESPQPCDTGTEEIYRHFFHGPSFQVLEKIISMTPVESMSSALIDHTSLTPSNLLSPLTIESAFQAAGWHHWTQTQEMVLPKSIGSLQIFHFPTDWEGLTIRAQTVPERPRCYNVDVFQNSAVVMTLRGLEFIEAPPSTQQGKDFWTPTPDVVIARSPADLQVVPSNEQSQLQERGSAKRKQDRLAGRSALHHLLRHSNIQSRLEHTKSGKPLLVDSTAEISISHSHGIGWAGLHRSGWIGLDAERIETRSDAFLMDWFTEGERILCGSSSLYQTIVWSTKEALSKLLGTGFTLHPTCFEIMRICTKTNTCQIEFHRTADAAWQTLPTVGALQCRWMQLGNDVLSFVTVSRPNVRIVC